MDKQPDWPPQTLVTGFPWYDRNGEGKLPAEYSAHQLLTPTYRVTVFLPPFLVETRSMTVVSAGLLGCRDEMEVLFTLLAERYERGSVLLTSNLPFSKWETILKTR